MSSTKKNVLLKIISFKPHHVNTTYTKLHINQVLGPKSLTAEYQTLKIMSYVGHRYFQQQN